MYYITIQERKTNQYTEKEMNTLKAKATINCNTCGCSLKRVKTIKVLATKKEDAIKEANEKIKIWKESLKGKNCKVCNSIIKAVAA